MTTDDEAVRSTGLLSGLLATHEGEHRVVNDVVAAVARIIALTAPARVSSSAD